MNAPEAWYQAEASSISVGQFSSAGIKDDNEDCIGIRVPDDHLLATKGMVAVIADGVSAADAGKEAAETCVVNFIQDYYATPETWSVKKSAHKVLIALNRWLYSQGISFSQHQKGYVSTLSILIIKSSTAYIFHIGDSRVYLMRDNKLTQLTQDHAVELSTQKTYLTRAMGLEMNVDVDFFSCPIQRYDRFFLSTDGLHDFIPFQWLRESLHDYSMDKEKLSQQLVSKALELNSDDNISCQIVDIHSIPNEQTEKVYSELTRLPFPPLLSSGERLDEYYIEEEIYNGTRSHLYRVSFNDKRYILKAPSPNYQDDPGYIESFAMESWIGSRVNNPHVVKVVHAQKEKHHLFYVMEDIQGQTLKQWLKEKPELSIPEITLLIGQLCKGIQALHRKETFHQDIKPDNVMVDSQGELKLIDFGSCYVAGIHEISLPFARDKAFGTYGYTAPEILVGENPSQASDIFSLGVLLYEWLAGNKPFDGKAAKVTSRKQIERLRYSPIYQTNPHVPLWYDAAIRKATHPNKQERYQEISEFLFDLQHPNAELQRLTRKKRRAPVIRHYQMVCTLQLMVIVGLLLLLVN